MPISIQRLTPHIGGVVTGVDIRQPLSAEDAAAIHAGMDEYAVLVFREQPMTGDQQLAFTEALGTIEMSGGTNLKKPEDRRRLFGIGNQLWHSDSSFKVTPAKYSLLHAIALPSKGGNTEFASMVAAWDAMDDELKAQCEGLICEHSQMFSRQQIGFFDFTEEEQKRFKPVRQSMVRINPATGRKSIYLASHAGGIVGWPVPESRIFLRDLIEQATRPEFVYAHEWTVGDLVMWDNRQTMHRVRSYPADEPRDMRRTTLAGEGPTAEQIAA